MKVRVHHVTVLSSLSLIVSVTSLSAPPLSQVPDGFIAHFYTVCEQISPVLAWGFLGPKSSLHDFCCFFKVGLSLDDHININATFARCSLVLNQFDLSR